MKDCDEPLLEEGLEPGSRWAMVFYGVIKQYGNGIGAMIITPQGTHFPFTARLTFKCTNNMAEYKLALWDSKKPLISESSTWMSLVIQLWS